MFIITAIASLALFLYGIDHLNSGLSKLFSEQIKKFLHLASKSVLWAILIGCVVTILIQNSNTPVVMLMGFVSSRLVDLKGAAGVILGADIGSTLTVQLLSFNIYSAGLFLIATGFLLRIFLKGQKADAVASFLTGLGFVLFSMKLMSDILGNINPEQSNFIKMIAINPYSGFILSLILTSIIQSSAATIGIAISLGNVGIINLSHAIPIILGANVGTCSTAVFTMFKADQAGKRVAIAHLLFKVIGVIIVVVFFKPFLILAELTSRDIAHQIANAHTIFNILITVVFAPFITPVVQFFEKYIKIGKDISLPDKPYYLDESAIKTPSIAFDYALKEIVRLGEYVYSMFALSYEALSKNDLWSLYELEAMNRSVERLASAIKLYIVRVSPPAGLSKQEANRQFELLTYVKNFEVISSIISQNLCSEIENKTTKGFKLSDEGWHEIREYFHEVMDFFYDIISNLKGDASKPVPALRERKKQFSQKELLLLRRHLERLHKGYSESIETSAMHIEIVSILRRIASQLAYMVEPISLS
ncbi:MAG: Na/Pi cotransporter family protein [bacterium]